MGVVEAIVCMSLAAVDGDTVKCDGVNMRPMGDGAPYEAGFDTPEIRQWADCDRERELGMLAKARMDELLQIPGLVVESSGEGGGTGVWDRFAAFWWDDEGPSPPVAFNGRCRRYEGAHAVLRRLRRRQAVRACGGMPPHTPSSSLRLAA